MIALQKDSRSASTSPRSQGGGRCQEIQVLLKFNANTTLQSVRDMDANFKSFEREEEIYRDVEVRSINV
jgi:hypothetical protein